MGCCAMVMLESDLVRGLVRWLLVRSAHNGSSWMVHRVRWLFASSSLDSNVYEAATALAVSSASTATWLGGSTAHRLDS